ncbi:hypothetical protein [Lysobacter enzymogenes]|jgi:hypothetical protein|uniref:hypothetical protein n=1 Tax=Lysobacter enzymogenes TaxID=69 RepID=UPI00089AFE92|nr:hypothetical protein [Lysobacter enzymogenes]SDX91228.1 hypothetical protein SAMN05421681_1096 [Lysobacter enzymogenes]
MRKIVVSGFLVALLVLGAAPPAAAQQAPALPPAPPDEIVSGPGLGVFYFHPADETGDAWSAGGLVGAGLNAFINSTSELKRASLEQRERLASRVDVVAERTALAAALHRADGPARLSLRYGMSQDMSALMVLAELGPVAAPRARPLRLAYQSPVHELEAKTAQEIEAELAEVERNKAQMSARQYRKAQEQARSPQREWPAIYSAHAQYWLADDGAALRVALAQARERMAAMIGFARDADPTLAPDGLLAKVGETLAQDGEWRTRVEAADLIVTKRAVDPEYYRSWNQFLAGRDAAR